MYYAESKMKLPDIYNYRPIGHNFHFSSEAARDVVIIHFPGHTKPGHAFQGDKVRKWKLHAHICKFLVNDQYFEMLGRTSEQASLDNLSMCNSG